MIFQTSLSVGYVSSLEGIQKRNTNPRRLPSQQSIGKTWPFPKFSAASLGLRLMRRAWGPWTQWSHLLGFRVMMEVTGGFFNPLQWIYNPTYCWWQPEIRIQLTSWGNGSLFHLQCFIHHPNPGWLGMGFQQPGIDFPQQFAGESGFPVDIFLLVNDVAVVHSPSHKEMEVRDMANPSFVV